MALVTIFWQKVSSLISRQSDGFSAFRFDQFDYFLSVWFLRREIVDRHIGAFARKGDRRCPSHPRVTSGDQRLSTRQTTR
jgi:hypothetical protein